jgi:uncharacterized protein (TIGR02118 family)
MWALRLCCPNRNKKERAMSISLQVIYPVTDDSTFDHDYYTATHLPLVAEHWGSFIESTLVTKGVAGGPDVPAPYHAVATIVFADQNALQSAMKVGGPVIADVPNFTNIRPQMLIGEVVG